MLVYLELAIKSIQEKNASWIELPVKEIIVLSKMVSFLM